MKKNISEQSRLKILEGSNKGNQTIKRNWDIKKKSYYKNPKTCLICGKAIEFKKRKKYKFCSQSCSATYNNRNRKEKIYCIVCGKLCGKNAFKYCSNKCYNNHIRAEKIDNWLNGKWNGLEKNGKSLSVIIRNYLLEKHRYKCENCGWGTMNEFTKRIPLTIHHIDGNYLNNVETNLKVLCPNCHSLTPTYGGANKENGRRFRYKE